MRNSLFINFFRCFFQLELLGFHGKVSIRYALVCLKPRNSDPGGAICFYTANYKSGLNAAEHLFKCPFVMALNVYTTTSTSMQISTVQCNYWHKKALTYSKIERNDFKFFERLSKTADKRCTNLLTGGATTISKFRWMKRRYFMTCLLLIVIS